MRLDSLASLKEATALYRSLGFVIMTSIVVSVVLTILLNVVFWLFRR